VQANRLVRDASPRRDRRPPAKRWPWQRAAARPQATRRVQPKAAPSPMVFLHWLRVTGITLAATCASLYGGYHGYFALMTFADEFPIRTVRTYAELQHIKPEHMLPVFGPSLDENFFEIDLQQTRERIESSPWVHNASIKKEWPDTLIVHLTERVPMARWGDDRILGSDLALFSRGEVSALPPLPQLRGVDRDSTLVWNRFRAFNDLLAPTALSLSELVMAERYSWKLVLSNGTEIVVDENRWQEKMERFVQFYNKIPEAERGLLARADLRYDNALAVKWKKKDDHPSAA
jgi:cell division protein FtsQ